MGCNEDSRWMVAVVDESVGQSSGFSEVVDLTDPSTQEKRQYVFVNKKHIVEVESLSSDFSSFFVGRHVVKDGDLYILNRVDPLFFILSAQEASEETKASWRPLDQVLESHPSEVQKSMQENQMNHLYQKLCNDQTDNSPYYKFSPQKALKWLKKKQEGVYQSLLQQDKRRLEREKKNSMGTQGGSVSATFYMPEDPMAATPESDNSASNTKQIKIESLQIVSSYLTEAWAKKFISSCFEDLDEDSIFATGPKKSSTPATASSAKHQVVETVEQPKKKAKIESAQTLGNKRLAKVSTKGMKSLSSFFAAPKAKKPKKAA